MKQKLNVTGMTCSACAARVDKAVRALYGISDVSVNVLTNSLTTEFDPDRVTTEQIIDAVTAAGYGASLPDAAPQNQTNAKLQNDEQKAMLTRMILSFVLLIPLMYVAMGSMMGLPLPAFLVGMQNAVSFAFAQFLLCLPVVVINYRYYLRGFRALLHRAPNMDTLISIGSSASLLYGIFTIFRMSHALGSGQTEIVAHYHTTSILNLR